MNVLALIGTGSVHALAAVAVSLSSWTTLEMLAHCMDGVGYWECLGVEKPRRVHDLRPATVFLHVPALDGASEIVSTPTGKGASR